jgi:outer membrane immunogenic protein
MLQPYYGEREMSKYIGLAVLSSSLLISVPAQAQGNQAFAGPRLEVIGGWDRVAAIDEHENSMTYGGALGYDLQFGKVVFGVETELTDSSADVCERNVVRSGDRLCIGAKRDISLGARLGAAISPSALLYAKAGYSNARFGYDYDDGATGAADWGNDRNLGGVRAGAGLEYKLGSSAYIKSEYRYSDYERGVSRHQALGGIGLRF